MDLSTLHAKIVSIYAMSFEASAGICLFDGDSKIRENGPLSERVTCFATEAMTLVDRYYQLKIHLSVGYFIE